MGKKIRDLDSFGGAIPEDAYIPLEYNNANYKAKASDLGAGSGGSGGAVQKFSGSISQDGVSTDAFKIGDLQGEDQIFISATVKWSWSAFPWQVSATYGRVDASGDRVLMATVGIPANGVATTNPTQYVALDGVQTGMETFGIYGGYQLKPIGNEVFFEIYNNRFDPATINWSSMVINF